MTTALTVLPSHPTAHLGGVEELLRRSWVGHPQAVGVPLVVPADGRTLRGVAKAAPMLAASRRLQLHCRPIARRAAAATARAPRRDATMAMASGAKRLWWIDTDAGVDDAHGK